MKASFSVATICLFALLPAPSLALVNHRSEDQVAVKSALTFDEAGAKERPVTKVITLLKEMLAQLEAEAKEDEEIYDKIACWCEMNDKSKGAAIEEAEARIAMLTTKLEELTATAARLNTEIENLEKEKAANVASLEQATALRTKAKGEFNEEEKDLLKSIDALAAAITVLSKHYSFLQVPRTHIVGVAASIQSQLQQHSALLKGVLTQSQQRAVTAFLQAPEDYFDAAPIGSKDSGAASGQIFGILKQMKETFESNLASTQEQEAKDEQQQAELEEAKESEIAATTSLIEKKTTELAVINQKIAETKEDLEDTKNSLSADNKFLMMLKEKCAMTDSEWEERQRTRHLEMEAVSKALAVLNADDAHNTFHDTFNSFVQRSSAVQSERRKYVSKMLSKVAKEVRDPRLATLAMSARLDAFTRVKKAIDDMVTDLMQQKKDEIKLRDYCIDELHDNTKKTDKAERTKEDITQKIADLESTIEGLAKEIAELKSEIAEMQKQLKKAAEVRAKENKEFEETVADQRATQKLLTQALEFLKGFYAENAAAALLQKQQQAKKAGQSPPPPPGFASYKNNAGSGSVMKMIEKIIYDAKLMEKDTVLDEKDAQKAYDDFVEDTNQSIEANNKNLVNKAESKAGYEKDLVEANKALASLMGMLEGLSFAAAEFHSQCDFTLKNFDVRQKARDQEVEALKQAKAILSGAKFSEFLQME